MESLDLRVWREALAWHQAGCMVKLLTLVAIALSVLAEISQIKNAAVQAVTSVPGGALV